jgi:excisionase family DNA binding protein
MEAGKLTEHILDVLRPVIRMEIERAIEARVGPALDAAGRVRGAEKLAFSMEEAAELLGYCESTVKEHVLCGRIGSMKVGGRRTISRESLLEFIREETCAEARRIEDAYRPAVRVAGR